MASRRRQEADMRIAVTMIAVIVLLAACGDQDETASSNGAVRIGAVASTDEAVQANRVEHSDETTPDDEIAPSSGVEHTGAATPANEADPSNHETRSSGADAHGGYNPYTETPTPLPCEDTGFICHRPRHPDLERSGSGRLLGRFRRSRRSSYGEGGYRHSLIATSAYQDFLASPSPWMESTARCTLFGSG